MIEHATEFSQQETARLRAMIPDFESPQAVCRCGSRAAMFQSKQFFCSAHAPAQPTEPVTQRASVNLKAASPVIERASTFAQRLVHVPVFGEHHGNCPCGDKSAYRYQLGGAEYLFCARHRPADHADVAQVTRALVSERLARLTQCPCGAAGTEQRYADAGRQPFWFCRAHVPAAFADVRQHSSALVVERLKRLTRTR